MDRVRTRFRNLSLQKSLVLYVIFFALLALLLCQGTAVACDLAEDAIYEAYPSLWERYYLTTEKGERLGEGESHRKGALAPYRKGRKAGIPAGWSALGSCTGLLCVLHPGCRFPVLQESAPEAAAGAEDGIGEDFRQ